MKLAILALASVIALLVAYQPQANSPMTPAPETKPVILTLHPDQDLDLQTVALFDSRRVPYDPQIAEEEEKRALMDRGKLPVPKNARNHNFD